MTTDNDPRVPLLLVLAGPPMRAPTVQAECDAKFRSIFAKFGDPDLTVARNHVTQCLNKLRGHKEWRADIVRSVWCGPAGRGGGCRAAS